MFEYCNGRRYAPRGDAWDQASAHWQGLQSDEGARFDREQAVDIRALKPQLSWGTSPQHAIDWDGVVPHVVDAPDDATAVAWQRAQDYMGVSGGSHLSDYSVDAAFIGSCTNSRLSDLRLAAEYLSRTGHRVANSVKALCVPGSGQVKRAAEAEGLDEIFRSAGFEWREPGCSMCFFAGGESFGEGVRVASTTNRNFEGRQGSGGAHTHCQSADRRRKRLCGAFGRGHDSMTPFTQHTGITAPLVRDNINTDTIIPSREMRSVSRSGLSEGLFAPWRYDDPNARTLDSAFVLNEAGFSGASILLTGANFGCGSSREHAVWALLESGFRVIMATSFATIFRNNALRNGLLTIELHADRIERLAEWVSRRSTGAYAGCGS